MKLTRPFAIASAAVIAVITATPASAIVDRPILKTFFQTGDVPTQEQFSNLIDSFLNYNDDGLTILRVGTNGSTGNAARKFEDDSIDITTLFTTVGTSLPTPLMVPEFGGHTGFLALDLSDASGFEHFGYLQLHMDGPPTDPAGIHVDYLVFNEIPNQPIVVQSVPEPASLALLGVTVPALLTRRRRTI